LIVSFPSYPFLPHRFAPVPSNAQKPGRGRAGN
jgi:hypothetical protein